MLLWRAGLRIHEALALTEGDLDQRRGSLLIRHGKGGRHREVGLDTRGWDELPPWLATSADDSGERIRATLIIGGGAAHRAKERSA